MPNILSCESQIIDFNDALKYIDAFIQVFPDLANEYGLGGFIRIPEFSDKGFVPLPVKIAHYCYERAADKLFLAIENSNLHFPTTEADIPGAPINPSLVAPSHENIFNLPKFGDCPKYRDLVDYLIYYNEPHTGNNRHLDNAMTVEYNSAFKEDPNNLFQFNNSHVNQYPLGIFCLQNFETLRNQQDLIGLRYYFGFDPGAVESTQNNKFRIIVIGVNSKYENIIFTKENGVYKKGVMLEKSWPPFD